MALPDKCGLGYGQSGAGNYVDNYLSRAHTYSAGAYNESMEFLGALSGYLPDALPSIEGVNFDDIDIDIRDPNIDGIPKPERFVPSPIIPNLPDPFVPQDIHQIAVGEAPEFDIPTPVLTPISPPDALTATAPGDAPLVRTDFEFPEDPSDLNLPAVPTFETLNIPEDFDYEFPVFSEEPPVYLGVPPPTLTFNWTEDPYDSELIRAVTAELLDRVTNGGTGLHPLVEQAIWDRARNREDMLAMKARDEVLTTAATRGFLRPSGSSLAAIDTLTQANQSKQADLSREIAIKQAELEQENLKFSIQQSISLEQMLIAQFNNALSRSFEAQKFIQQAAVDIFNANLKRFEVEMELYKTYAVVFETRLKAELNKAQIYKTKIEAEALKNQINESKVKLYLAQIDGIKAEVDIYKTQVDAISSRISAESLKLQNYKLEIDAYSALVTAKRDEFGMYSEQVKAELSKVEVFDSQVKAFVSRVQGYSALVDAESKIADNDLSVEKLRLDQYMSRLDYGLKVLQSDIDIIKSKTEVYKIDSEVYKNLVDAEVSSVELDIRVADIDLRKEVSKAEIALKNADIQLKNAEISSNLTLEAMKSGAQVGSSLAAASLSGINIGASLSQSGRTSHDVSCNTNHNVSYEA